jgi:hypothetical protein
MTGRTLTLLCATALAAGCVHDDRPWKPAGGGYDSGNWFGPRISLTLPPEWMQLNFVEDGLVATRDGFNLQTISVRRIDADKPLPNTKKLVRKGMRPNELAEVLVDDLRASGKANGMKVLDTRPVVIGGTPGFRTTVAFKDGWGLRIKAVIAGALVDDRVFRIAYTAPARHYFDQDLATFDAALGSVRIR